MNGLKGYPVLGQEPNYCNGLDGLFSDWNPLKAVAKIASNVENVTKKVTAALPISEKFDAFVNKTVIDPQASSDRALLSIFDPKSTLGKIVTLGANSATGTAMKNLIQASPQDVQKRMQKIVGMGDSAVMRALDTVDWHTEKVVAWELKNPALLRVVGAIVVACVCGYAFGAWGSIISKGGMYAMTNPPKTPPLVDGSIDASMAGRGAVTPELSLMFKTYADAHGIPVMLLPVDGTDGIWIPASEDAIIGGTLASLDWISASVVAAAINVDTAITILQLLQETISDAISLGLAPGAAENLHTTISNQITTYQSGGVPAAVTPSAISALSTPLLIGASVFGIYFLTRSKK